MPSDTGSTIHRQVLDLIRSDLGGSLPEGLALMVEQAGGRIDLPNRRFGKGAKLAGQRKNSLCYTDAVIHDCEKPRLLIEVVHSSPKSPNGITGLTINAERVAQFYGASVDLLYIVLATMKSYKCCKCEGGHRIVPAKVDECFSKSWEHFQSDQASILHEGTPVRYRIALHDYPIASYLEKLRPPVVLFLNSKRIANDWESYRKTVVRRISSIVADMLSKNTREAIQFRGIEELLPSHYQSAVPRLPVG